MRNLVDAFEGISAAKGTHDIQVIDLAQNLYIVSAHCVL